MFKSLSDFWSGKDFLVNVTEEFGNMLKDAQVLFEMVCEKLFKGKGPDDLEEKVYDIDKKINLTEKDIRKRIISHLSIRPSIDIPMSLLMMSVVKDAERLGDYAKNIYQITRIMKNPLNIEAYSRLFGDMYKVLISMFNDTKKAFIESDEKAAKNIWAVERTVVRKCDRIIEELAKSSFDAEQAVTFTLIARYFKRVAAHLTNIATSVILPISELDFFDEKGREERE